LGNRSYEGDRVLLNYGKRSKNDDFRKHSLASLIKNKVKPQSPRALLDSIRTDIPASKVAQVESQNGDTYTTKLHKNLKDERTLASSIERSTSSEILNQAAQTAEFNKALGAQRSSRERYLNDYWKRQHEAPVALPQRQGTVDGNQDFNYAQLALQQAEASRVQDRGQLVVSTSNNLNANQAMGAFGSIGTPQPGQAPGGINQISNFSLNTPQFRISFGESNSH